MNKRNFLGSLFSLTLIGCSTGPRYYSPPPSSSYPSNYPSNFNSSITATQRQDIVLQAMAMLDRGYTYGGKKVHTGFDCSGLVSFVYKESAGIALKGSALQMANATRAIKPEQAHPGDLVFFNTLGTSFSHVGIYIGSGKFIHAANERTGVRQEKLSNSYWSKRFEGYRSLGA